MKLRESKRKLKYHLSQLIQGYRVDMLTLRGMEKYSHLPLTTSYIGSKEHLYYVTDTLYYDYEVVDSFRNIHAMKWVKSIDRLHQKHDLVVCDLPSPLFPFFKNKPYIFIPEWVNHTVDLEKSWDDVLQGFRKHMRREALRKIKQHNLTYSLSNESADFEMFYHNMLLPCMEKRHGMQTMKSDKEITRRKFNMGELVKLYMDKDIIGMGLTVHDKENKCYSFNKIGSPYMNDKTIYRAVSIGLYYFIIKEAFSRGCSNISLGNTRPQLNDGLFQYKRKWGSRIGRPKFFQSNLLFNPKHLNGALGSIFSNNVFLVTEEKAYSAKLIVPKEKANADDISSIYERYDTKGLNSFKIFSCDGFNGSMIKIKDGLPEKIKLFNLSESRNKAKDFGRL